MISIGQHIKIGLLVGLLYAIYYAIKSTKALKRFAIPVINWGARG